MALDDYKIDADNSGDDYAGLDLEGFLEPFEGEYEGDWRAHVQQIDALVKVLVKARLNGLIDALIAARGNLKSSQEIGSTRVLTASDAGRIFRVQIASPITITLPSLADINDASQIVFVNTSGVTATIQTASSQPIRGSGIASTSFSLTGDAHVRLTSHGTITWLAELS